MLILGFVTSLGLVALAIVLIWRTWSGVHSLAAPAFLFPAVYLVTVYSGDVSVAVANQDLRPALIPAVGIFSWAVGSALTSPAGMRRSFVFNTRLTHGPVGPMALRVTAWVIVALGFSSVIGYFALIGVIPLWEGVRGLATGSLEASGMHDIRRRITPGHRMADVRYIGQGYWRVFYFRLLPIGIALLWLLRKANTRDSLLTACLMVSCVVVNLLEGRIWMGVQVASFFFLLMITASTFRESGMSAKALRRAISIGGTGLAGLILMASVYRYLQFLSGRAFADFWGNLFQRMFMLPSGHLFLIFPDRESFRLGTTWLSDIRGFLPGTHRSFAYEVHELVHGTGWGYTLSPTVPGALYVNFGALGVVAGMFTLGVFVGLVFRSLRRLTHPLGLVTGTTFAVGIAFSVLGDLTTILMTLIVVGVFISFTLVVTALPMVRGSTIGLSKPYGPTGGHAIDGRRQPR